MQRGFSTTSRLGVSRLEARENPAGNVAVSFGEVLQLRGDDLSNQVAISQDAGGLTVTGLYGTTVNGQPVVRSGSRPEKVDVKLFGGADELFTDGLTASVDINIEMDQGNDLVDLRNTTAGANISVKTDAGIDNVFASGVRTGGDFSIETGEGRSGVYVFGTTVGKTMTVIGGLSTDLVSLVNSGTYEDLNVETKEGNDRVDLINWTSWKNIKVDAGTGNDFVAVTNVFAAKDAVFIGGDGFDTFDNNGVLGGEKLEIKEFDRFL